MAVVALTTAVKLDLRVSCSGPCAEGGTLSVLRTCPMHPSGQAACLGGKPCCNFQLMGEDTALLGGG